MDSNYLRKMRLNGSMNRKWVLYIGGFDMPDNNAAAQRVTANAKAFRDLGYNTFFIGFSKRHSTNNIREYEGFSYINLPYPQNVKQWFIYLTSIKTYLTYINRSPNLVIAYNFPAIALNNLRNYTSKRGIPIVADCTEWEDNEGHLLFKLIKGFDTWYRMTIVHPKLNGMITISSFLYSYYKGKMDNVIKVPPLVDLEMKKWENAQTGTSTNANHNISIIYAGSPARGNKDRLDIILNALSKIKAEGITCFTFTIIGIAENQYINVFKLSTPSNLIENVIFKGRLTHNDTLNEIKKAHFSLFLRENNLKNNAGFPTKLVESISCGTPVLSNSTSNIKDYIIPNKNGYLIDISTEFKLISCLKYAIQLCMDEIKQMKLFCISSKTFYYKNFITEFEELFQRLSIK